MGKNVYELWFIGFVTVVIDVSSVIHLDFRKTSDFVFSELTGVTLQSLNVNTVLFYQRANGFCTYLLCAGA